MERNEGFLNLNKYINEKHNIDNYNLDYLGDLKIIRPEFGSSSTAFWFEYNNFNVLFKEVETQKAYLELILEEFIKNIGLNSAHYDLAQIDSLSGVISYDFKKEDYKYITMDKILNKYYEEVIMGNEEKYDFPEMKDSIDVVTHLNNLEDVWSALEHYFHDRNDKEVIIRNIIKDIIKLFVFDILTLQSDRDAQNYMIQYNDNDASLAPIYDYSESLLRNDNTSFSIKVDIENIKNRAPYRQVLNTFFEKSSASYQEYVYNIMKELNEEKLNKAISDVEKRCDFKMSDKFKEIVNLNFLSNYLVIMLSFDKYVDNKKNINNRK